MPDGEDAEVGSGGARQGRRERGLALRVEVDATSSGSGTSPPPRACRRTVDEGARGRFGPGTTRAPSRTRAPTRETPHGDPAARSTRAGLVRPYSGHAGRRSPPGRGRGALRRQDRAPVRSRELCVAEWWSPTPDRGGAAPPPGHADWFSVLKGELAILVDDEEARDRPGAFVYAPPGLVHDRSLSPDQFPTSTRTGRRLRAELLRALSRGSRAASTAWTQTWQRHSRLWIDTATRAPDERRKRVRVRVTGVATIEDGRDELAVIEFALGPSFDGPQPARPRRSHRRVLRARGRDRIPGRRDEERRRPPALSWRPTPGVEHTFTNGGGRSRLLTSTRPARNSTTGSAMSN